jgi:predicted nucleic acid-binding protein
MTIQSRNVVLDTNIWSYFFDYPFVEGIVEELVRNKNNIIIPTVVRYELLKTKGLTPEQCETLNDLTKHTFESIPLCKEIVDNALCIWDADVKTGNGTKKNTAKDIDRFIGATAFYSNAVLITANQRDFPMPYFDDLDLLHQTYECANEGHKQIKVINIHILEPNVEELTKKAGESQALLTRTLHNGGTQRSIRANEVEETASVSQ